MTTDVLRGSFVADVLDGLTARNKFFPSRHCHYFYDSRGSALFRRITRQESYYLTRCEDSILSRNAGHIARKLSGGKPFRLLELGAGDGHKMFRLLDSCASAEIPCRYVACDIAPEALAALASGSEARFDGTEVFVDCLAFEHGAALGWLAGQRDDELPTTVAFLGSNLGNLSRRAAERFLRRMRGALKTGDWLLLGTDQKPHARKPAEVVTAAYSDAETAKFNANLLVRLNREIGADFDPAQFMHHACYVSRLGRVEMSLISRCQQRVCVNGHPFDFAPGEAYFVERSNKFNRFDVEALGRRSGFRTVTHLCDEADWFLLSLLRAD